MIELLFLLFLFVIGLTGTSWGFLVVFTEKTMFFNRDLGSMFLGVLVLSYSFMILGFSCIMLYTKLT